MVKLEFQANSNNTKVFISPGNFHCIVMLTVSRRKAKDNVKRTHPQCTCTVQLRDKQPMHMQTHAHFLH